MKPLPEKLKIGMKLKCCSLAYDGDEVLEVFKVDKATDRIYLMRLNGVALKGNGFTQDELERWDYKIVI